MYNSNPYSQWSTGNGPSRPSDLWPGYEGSAPPSVFGALPSSPTTFPSSPSEITTLYFTSFKPTIINCLVVGPQSTPIFSINSDASLPNYTVWKGSGNKSVALVEWAHHPVVEIRGIVPKQGVREWLRLSTDRRSRVMDCRGGKYVWGPNGQHICLFTTTHNPQILARIIKAQGVVTLELTSFAMQLGLMEACAVATVLLQCGRNID